MTRPLHPPPAPLRPAATRRVPGAARSLTLVAGLVAVGGGGCAGREAVAPSTARVDRDREAREAVLAAIEQDHAALAALIASDRFAQPNAIYSDPELRSLALRLIERTRRLRDLAETDFLAPGEP